MMVFSLTKGAKKLPEFPSESMQNLIFFFGQAYRLREKPPDFVPRK